MTSRRRRPLKRTIPYLRDTKLIIIATEGEKTEKQYFEDDVFTNLRVHVRVLGTKDGFSAPKHVLQRLRGYKKQYDIQAGDQLWLVVDKDRWPDKQLAAVCSKAIGSKKSKVSLALSNPCFELWLYLHIDEWRGGTVSQQEIEKVLRSKLGSYNKANLKMSIYEKNIEIAVQRAKELETNGNSRWPENPGTHVYRVVEQIQKLK